MPKNYNKIFHERIVKLLDEKGWNTAEFARQLSKVDPHSPEIQHGSARPWVKGLVPEWHRLNQIQQLFGVSLDWLLGVSDDPGDIRVADEKHLNILLFENELNERELIKDQIALLDKRLTAQADMNNRILGSIAFLTRHVGLDPSRYSWYHKSLEFQKKKKTDRK